VTIANVQASLAQGALELIEQGRSAALAPVACRGVTVDD
jgi:hypothetical protein